MRTSVSDRSARAATSDRTVSQQAFDLWSQVYDDPLNPLLSLEQRFLANMLPNVRGLDVLDAGCGTGRWLAHLAAQSPKTLVGIDSSPEMLAHATAKSIPNADLRLGDCTVLPVQSFSIDLVLASFVLSYIRDLEKFFEELAHATRPNAIVFLTDMHPETALSCNWKRSFKRNNAAIEIEAQLRPLEQIASLLHVFGLEMVSLLEPCFGKPEQLIFERRGKLEAFHSSAGLPAIYILQMKKLGQRGPKRNPVCRNTSDVQVTGARCSFGAGESLHVSIVVECGRIRQIYSKSLACQKLSASLANNIDIAGYLVFPGLINAHDHLEFGLFPNLGDTHYKNSAAWAENIHRAEARTIERHRRIPQDVRLWWGGIRNLICGVTTVCHHNPLPPVLLNADFPVRVLTEFGWAHSLAFDAEVFSKFQATPRNMPFILHAAEGIDQQSANEIFDLDRMGALDGRTILVHGLALTHKGISLLNQRGAALVVCPTSNRFLFGRVPTHELLTLVANLVLSSDSPLTAAGDLLDEIRFVKSAIGLNSNDLYEMVTTRPAKILRLRNGEGHLKPGAVADLMAVRDDGSSPAETMAGLSCEDVELVLLSGRVQLASPAIFDRLPRALRHGLQPLDVDGHIRWIRAPLDRLFAEAEKVLGSDIRVGGKRVCHVSPA